MAESREEYHSVLRRVLDALAPEGRDLVAIIFYGVVISLLSLTIPVAVQALVNSVAYGQLTQQLLVLSLLVFLVMSFSGLFSTIQYYYVELLQRRLFTRYALDLAYRIPRIGSHGVRARFGAEFVNPFLEVIVLHKSMSHLLLGGLGLVLQVIVGLILLAVYHPLLLVFALGLIVVIGLIFSIGGYGGVRTADAECTAKYAMLTWLEDMARMPIMFHSARGETFGLVRADEGVRQWLDARRSHFHILFRQNIAMFLVYALASSLLLGLGGVLVIKGQISLGQLVAAELVLSVALSGLAKFGKHLESYYDLMAALRKLDNLRAAPLEAEGDQGIPDTETTPVVLELRGLSVTFPESDEPLFSNVNLTLPAGHDACIYGTGSSGKTVLFDCIYGLYGHYQGQVSIDGFNLEDITRRSLRTRIGLVGEPEFFHGTLEENLTIGSQNVSRREIRELLDVAGLSQTVSRLPDGLQSELIPQSGFFSGSELIRFSLIRTALARPGLILLDQSLDGLDEGGLAYALQLLFPASRPWSVLATTNKLDVARHFSSCYELVSGEFRPMNILRASGDTLSIQRGES